MTAHAMKGYRERCIDAGMDDYLAKPINVAEVRAMLEKWTAPTMPMNESQDAATDVPAPSETAIEDRQPLDVETALDQLSGDRELFDVVVGTFVDEIPAMLAELRSAVSDSNAQQLHAAAHSLKGAASNISAEPVRQIAERLEGFGKRCDFRAVDETFADLERHLELLQKYVNSSRQRRDA